MLNIVFSIILSNHLFTILPQKWKKRTDYVTILTEQLKKGETL